MELSQTQKPYELVPFPVEEKLIGVIRAAQDSLFISTPYIKDYGVSKVLNNAKTRKLQLLTNLDLRNITGAGFDLDSLLRLWDFFDLKVSSLGKLHAKILVTRQFQK